MALKMSSPTHDRHESITARFPEQGENNRETYTAHARRRRPLFEHFCRSNRDPCRWRIAEWQLFRPGLQLQAVSRPLLSYEKRTGPTVVLPTRGLRAIVSGYGYVSTALTFMALPVDRTLCPPAGPCLLDVESGTAQGVPCFLFVCDF